MKKALFLILSVFWLAGCSTDGDDAKRPTAGNYIGRSGSFVLSVELANNKCTRVTGFKDNAVFSQVANITTTGQYPDYIYSGDGFNLICHFTDAKNFSASVSGQMPILYKGGYLDVSGTYNFTYTKDVLDANGDGVLDNSQNI